ncbi:MAG: sulfotransferase [Hyphomonadaceae bacterium]|nr:sulfotransferase [Hyphomonadaceae bacterium]
MSDPETGVLIEKAERAKRAGRLGEALVHYSMAVARAPADAELLSSYGVMLMRAQREDEAFLHLQRAVDLRPAHAGLLMNLFEWHALKGEHAVAVDLAGEVLRLEPKFWVAWQRLGEVQAMQREFSAAAQSFANAVDLRPRDASLIFKLARAHFDARQFDAAERALVQAAELAPNHPAILRLDAELKAARGDWRALENAAAAWTRVEPQAQAAWKLLAKAQWETGRPRHAMANFEKAMAMTDADAETLATYGRLCITALEYDAAAASLDEAERLNPRSTHTLSAQAILAMFRGQHDRAESYCRRALSIEPLDVSTLKVLTQITGGRVDAVQKQGLLTATRDPSVREQDRISAHFALGDCYHAEGDAHSAFDAYAAGNAAALHLAEREGLGYVAEKRVAEVNELMSLLAFQPMTVEAENEPTPIFIVGMPRSGTTLIESVLAAHADVIACGERPVMRWVMQEALAVLRERGGEGITSEHVRRWREAFWADLPGTSGRSFVTDKNPWNYDALPILFLVFPSARVVHLKRNPLDTGLSIFRNEFSKFVSFKTDLRNVGHYYTEYARLMAHWERTMRERYVTVQYEDFVANFESACPALLDSCGLTWDSACLKYWLSDRVIGTLSTMQARKPPRLGDVGGGKYAPFLTPLADALRRHGLDPVSGERQEKRSDAARVGEGA